MEKGWREDGGRMEGGWREDGGWVDGGWVEGGRVEGWRGGRRGKMGEDVSRSVYVVVQVRNTAAAVHLIV